MPFFGGADISDYLEAAYKRALYCFSRNTNKYFKKGTIDVHHTGQYAILLCYLARVAFEAGDRETADRVYALNKALHGFDIFYEVELPNVFFMEHPVGTVLGRAQYSDRLFLGQNVTVGGNKGCYPTIGENVCLHAGCIITLKYRHKLSYAMKSFLITVWCLERARILLLNSVLMKR